MIIDQLIAASSTALDWHVLAVVAMSAIYGLCIGAIPGLSATMAVALLVPVTFFMEPVPAIASMVTCTAMAIFSGDIPSCLLRIPGTPSSAAYTEEAYAMTVRGESDLALGTSLVCSSIGGVIGTLVLIFTAPFLAEFAIQFSSYEYFWLVLLGLTCAVFIGADQPLKGLVSLLIGLAVTTVGMNNPAGYPRFAFGNTSLYSGYSLIPVMVGMFAVSEVIRYALKQERIVQIPKKHVRSVLLRVLATIRRYPASILRGSSLGTLIGALPGAGADIAAYISYALSKKFSKQPEKFGTGHVEGIAEASSANNSALSGAWIPALVFGIPGDSITAIVIGVLYMKGINPGPTIFFNESSGIYAIFIIFLIANIILIPFGLLAIRFSKYILRVPPNVLMPTILLFCVVGAYSINNSVFDIVTMLMFGIIAYLMEENGYPLAPAILGIILGNMLESNFVNSVIKSDGDWLSFIDRPISGTLAFITVCVWVIPFLYKRFKIKREQARSGVT